MNRILIIFILFLLAIGTEAQTRRRNFRQHELGIFIGGSYYIGDLNPRRQFFLTQPAGGLFYRFTPNYRYAFRAGVNTGNIMGDDSQSQDPDQRQRNLNFKSRLNEIYALAEFNFVEYRISNDKYRFTFFIFAGLDVFNFKPMGNLGGGTWESLQPLRTEGQTKKYKLWQVGIPFGLGVKLNVAKRMGLGLEWGPRKTFTDYLDDVSGLYPDPLVNPPSGVKGSQYSNRSLEGGNLINGMRGNPRTKDWFFYFGLTINIKLRLSSEPCYSSGMN